MLQELLINIAVNKKTHTFTILNFSIKHVIKIPSTIMTMAHWRPR